MSTSSVSTQTQQLTQSLSANTAERGDPKLEKKFLLTKPTYRPNPRSREGGIACQQPPPCPPPGSSPPPSSLTASGPDPPPPPVQNRNGATITLPAAPHRHKNGVITYFDCRYTIAHHQDHRHTTSRPAALLDAPPPSSLALAPSPRHHPTAPPPRRIFFSFFPPLQNPKSR